MRVNFHVLEGVGLGMGVLGQPGLALLVPFAQHWLCLRGDHLTIRWLLAMDTAPILLPSWARRERVRVHVSTLASYQGLGLPGGTAGSGSGCSRRPSPDLSPQSVLRASCQQKSIARPVADCRAQLCFKSAPLFELHFHAAKNTRVPYVRLQVPRGHLT